MRTPDPTIFTKGSIWYVMGDAKDQVKVVKCCKKKVRIDGYYHDNKLMYPMYLYKEPKFPKIIEQMAQCQREKTQRANARKIKHG